MVIWTCDRCGSQERRSLDKPPPGLPLEWRRVSFGYREPVLLCEVCAQMVENVLDGG